MANGNGKWQMPTAECKIGANRNLSKDLAMFHADFTLARSHTLAGQWKLVAKSIFQYNRKSSAVSATSGVPLLFFFFRFCLVFFLLFSLDRALFPLRRNRGNRGEPTKSLKSRSHASNSRLQLRRHQRLINPKSHGKPSASLFLFHRRAPSSNALQEIGGASMEVKRTHTQNIQILELRVINLELRNCALCQSLDTNFFLTTIHY